jgi:hypothetical protein
VKIVYKNKKGDVKWHKDESKHVDIFFHGYR